MTGSAMDPATTRALDAVCAAAWEHWDAFDRTVRERDFHPFVASNYDVVRRALETHCRPGQRFLELGSANGAITVMAALLGCESFGIELDAGLVRTAQSMADRFGARATFVCGSFLPAGYRWATVDDQGYTSTLDAGESGYVKLGKALDDFDIVFAYPWDGDTELMLNLVRDYGSTESLVLLHHTNGGVDVWRGGKRVG
jgi:SAM-dependent methyltransferase